MNDKVILENYGERMNRLAIYHPLMQLSNKRQKDNQGNVIDLYGLGLVTLLFFFENMITRNKKSGVKELGEFLYQVAYPKVDLSYEQMENLARQIIQEFRPASGKRSTFEFYDWEKGTEEQVSFSILKAAKADLKTNTQYYILDEQGLELIFATKEYFSEFQVSINQLLLRKQLEKGEFMGALRQIDEMALAVGNLYERIIKIKHEVNRNITSEETYERYSNLIEDINLRLIYENEEFDELHEFVSQTKEKMKYNLKSEKDQQAYEMILRIDRALSKVHNEHKNLLKQSIELKTTALEAAKQALYFIGIDTFNFEQEITNAFLANILPSKASGMLIAPFLPMPRYRAWAPLSVFAKQRIEKEQGKEYSRNFVEVTDEEEEAQQLEILRTNFKTIAKQILEPLLQGATLKEIITYVKEKNNELLKERLFYHFWLLLHQKSPLDMKRLETSHIFGGLKELLPSEVKEVEVLELKEILTVAEHFEIQNMIIRIKGE